MRRTKIVATLGPSTWQPKEIRALLEAGVDVVRLNLAHGTPAEHGRASEVAREQADELGKVVGVLADLPGPKMRTGVIEQNEVLLRPGDPFILCSGDVPGDWMRVSTTVPELAKMVQPGEEVYLADGTIVLRVDEVKGDEVHTEVVRGGRLRSRKGMHLPAAERLVHAFTDEDRRSLGDAIRMKVDFVGLSFVRDADDVRRAKDALPKRGYRPLIVAKVETRSAVENIDGIVAEADAIMVARGDLGIQMPLHEVPLIQKHVIETCNLAGKPVITATQMLESMTRQPLPTRAEVTDVANAVLDGTHALMLSEETAIGEYPEEAVREMVKIASFTERQAAYSLEPHEAHRSDDRVSWAVAHAAVEAATDLSVSAILCPTRSGSTAFRVAAFRPRMPIVGLSERMETLGPLSIVWGVIPLKVAPSPDEWTAEEDVERAAQAARRAGLVHEGDHVAVVAGTPGRRAGRTDYVRVVRVD